MLRHFPAIMGSGSHCLPRFFFFLFFQQPWVTHCSVTMTYSAGSFGKSVPSFFFFLFFQQPWVTHCSVTMTYSAGSFGKSTAYPGSFSSFSFSNLGSLTAQSR